jgi:hypothetical protein
LYGTNPLPVVGPLINAVSYLDDVVAGMQNEINVLKTNLAER